MNLCESLTRAKSMWCTPRTQTAAIAAVTFKPGATGKELVKSLVTFSKAGKGWQKYVEGKTGGLQDSTIGSKLSGELLFKGEAVLLVLGQHDIVILQHWPPVELVRLIKEAGAKKVLLWTDFESYPGNNEWGQGHWAPASKGLDEVQFKHYMQNNDRYAWTDMSEEYLVEWLLRFWVSWFDEKYGDHVDGLFFDNVLERPYMPGTPSTGLAHVAAYHSAWTRLIHALKNSSRAKLDIWGNTALHNPYALDMPYVEHLFKYQEWPEIITFKPRKLFIGLVESTGKTYVDHPEYLELLRRNIPRSTELIIQTMRSDQWLFHL